MVPSHANSDWTVPASLNSSRSRQPAAKERAHSWSWRIGRIAGIEIYVHGTFLLFLAWVAAANWLRGQGLAGAIAGTGFVLAVFGCVVLHELGHALMARRFGIRTRNIMLLPIGGVARLERMPEAPRQELLVALAGPAVNLAIAAMLAAVITAREQLASLAAIDVTHGSMLDRLLVINVFLAGFNLLPAFPMDGGRVLRALLAHRMAYKRATQIAAATGQAISLLLGVVGLFANPMLVFVALFVWIGAAQEAGAVELREALHGVPVRRAMLTEFVVLQPYDTLGYAAEQILAGSQQDFPVLDGDRVVGVLTREGLIAGLARLGAQGSVADAMARSFESADDREALETAFERMQSSGSRAMPVLHGERLVGLLTTENVAELLMIRDALAAHRLRAA